MFRLLLVSALVAVAFGANARIRPRVPMLDGRIVGGEDAEIEDYPYQVSFQYYGQHICGASIIAVDKILTAAHCTDGMSASSLSIRYGSSIRESGGKVVKVDSIDQHYAYDAYTTDYDVSVLHLSDDIQLDGSAQIVNLVSSGAIEGGRSAVVTGWGTLEAGGDSPYQLQVVTVKEVDRDDCKSAYSPDAVITRQMICFGADGKDSCQGDSGGPLVSDGEQVGIVSWGFGCADPNYPGIYSNVAVLRSFILSSR